MVFTEKEMKKQDLLTRRQQLESNIMEKTHNLQSTRQKIHQIKLLLRTKLQQLDTSRQRGKECVQDMLKSRHDLLSSRKEAYDWMQSVVKLQKERALALKNIFAIREVRHSVTIFDFQKGA